jgi:hypothetical protein
MSKVQKSPKSRTPKAVESRYMEWRSGSKGELTPDKSANDKVTQKDMELIFQVVFENGIDPRSLA